MSTIGHDPRPSRNSILILDLATLPPNFDRGRVRSSTIPLFFPSPLLFLFLLLPFPSFFLFFPPRSAGARSARYFHRGGGRGAGRHRRSRSSSTHIRPGVAQGCVHRPPSARLPGWAGVQQPGSRMWRRWMNRGGSLQSRSARALATPAAAAASSFLHSGGGVGVRTIRKG